MKLYLFWNAMQNIFDGDGSWTKPNFLGVFSFIRECFDEWFHC